MIYASVKGPKTWKTQKHYCLGVSLGSKNHEGHNFQAIVDWLNKAEFESGIIDLSDTLHRYNYMLENDLTEAEAREMIHDASAKWIRDHKPMFDQLKAPFKIITWDTWLQHEKFDDYMQQFQNAYDNDTAFRIAILKDVEAYVTRRFGIPLAAADARTIKLSADFLLEELAAHSIIYEGYPCAVVYPGKQQESFKMAREGLVPNVPTGMQQSFHTRLTLHNLSVINNPQPQQAASPALHAKEPRVALAR